MFYRPPMGQHPIHAMPKHRYVKSNVRCVICLFAGRRYFLVGTQQASRVPCQSRQNCVSAAIITQESLLDTYSWSCVRYTIIVSFRVLNGYTCKRNDIYEHSMINGIGIKPNWVQWKVLRSDLSVLKILKIVQNHHIWRILRDKKVWRPRIGCIKCKTFTDMMQIIEDVVRCPHRNRSIGVDSTATCVLSIYGHLNISTIFSQVSIIPLLRFIALQKSWCLDPFFRF